MPIAVAWLRGWCDSCWHRQAVPREAARRGSDGTGPTVAGSGGCMRECQAVQGIFRKERGPGQVWHRCRVPCWPPTGCLWFHECRGMVAGHGPSH